MSSRLGALISFVLLFFMAGAPVQAQSVADIVAADKGVSSERGRPPSWYLDQYGRITDSIASLRPQRPGVIDAYVVVVGLDADPVFQREAAETAKVLARRYGSEERTILLSSGAQEKAAQGSPANITTILGAVAETMDLNEDVLVLYTTSHGGQKVGLVYKDGRDGFGMLAPRRLARILNGLGIKRRLVMISACYSGTFVPPLQSDDSIVITAASATTTSFGCAPSNDWTFFGDALINHGLRTSKPLRQATQEATALVTKWENKLDVIPSNPQQSFGSQTGSWLSALEARVPAKATPKVGKPAFDSESIPVTAGKSTKGRKRR